MGAGSGSLRCNPGPDGADNAVPYNGKYLPDGNQKVRCSMWVRLYGASVVTYPFIKLSRAGKRAYTGDVLDDYSSTAAKYYPTISIYDNGSIGENSVKAAFRSAAGETSGECGVEPGESVFGNVPNLPQPEIDMTQWTYIETTLALNTIGTANGLISITTDTHRQLHCDQVQIKTDANEDLSYIMPVVELEGAGDAYDYAMSRYSIDVGPDCGAKLELINASSSAAMTAGPIELKIVSWSDGEAIADAPASIPSGYNWKRSTTSAGVETISAL